MLQKQGMVASGFTKYTRSAGDHCKLKTKDTKELPGGAVVTTLHVHCRGTRFNPRAETEIPQSKW